MAWNNKYWDAFYKIYCWPRYIGLTSISEDLWSQHDKMVCVPASFVNKSGPLYTRSQNIRNLMDDLSGREEILNHIFDITFSIAADEVLDRMFARPLGFKDPGPFESLGGEIAERFGWRETEKVTQQNAFFVSPCSILAVELKLKSSTWPEQIAKYVALMAGEELANGPRKNLGLLYILPENAVSNHWTKCGLTGPVIDRSFIRKFRKDRLPSHVVDLFEQQPEHVASVLDRLTLNAVSWTWIRDEISAIRAGLGNHRGDQTLDRLLHGFLEQLVGHRYTGILMNDDSQH